MVSADAEAARRNSLRFSEVMGRLFRVQTGGDFLLGNRAFANHLPAWLGDIDGGRAGPAAQPSIQHQVDAPVHGAENIDAATAGRRARNVGAGGDERMTETVDQA